MSALARAGYTLPAAVRATPPEVPQFPPGTAPLSAPDYTLPFPTNAEVTTPALLRQMQQSGALARWLDDMQDELGREANSNGGSHPKRSASEAEDDPMADDGAEAPLSALEERLLERLLAFVDSDPEVAALLRAAERAEQGPPPSLHELMRAVNQRCQRTVLAPPQARHPASILPELQSRCGNAFERVSHAPPQSGDPAPPSEWEASERETRAGRLLAASAESLILSLQNEQVERSNRMHEGAASRRIVL